METCFIQLSKYLLQRGIRLQAVHKSVPPVVFANICKFQAISLIRTAAEKKNAHKIIITTTTARVLPKSRRTTRRKAAQKEEALNEFAFFMFFRGAASAFTAAHLKEDTRTQPTQQAGKE